MILTLDQRLRVGGLFSELEPEKEQGPDREMKIGEISILEKMMEGYNKSRSLPPMKNMTRKTEDIDPVYESCIENIPDDYTSDDIYRFIRFVDLTDHLGDDGFFNEPVYSKLGLYLSALCNHCPNNDLVLSLERFSHISRLGYRNNKNMYVTGILDHPFMFMESGNVSIPETHCLDVAYRMSGGNLEIRGNNKYSLGEEMSGGKIIVNGNAGGVGTAMEGGIIVVNGNTERAGVKMNGGKIVINGNVIGDKLGYNMDGGEILINGSVNGRLIGNNMEDGYIHILGNVKRRVVGKEMRGGEISIEGRKFPISKECYGGDIYHKGKLVVKDGRSVE